jgi:hypothetical protein
LTTVTFNPVTVNPYFVQQQQQQTAQYPTHKPVVVPLCNCEPYFVQQQQTAQYPIHKPVVVPLWDASSSEEEEEMSDMTTGKGLGFSLDIDSFLKQQRSAVVRK